MQLAEPAGLVAAPIEHLGGAAGMQERRAAVGQAPVDAERLEQADQQPLDGVEVRPRAGSSARSPARSRPASRTPEVQLLVRQPVRAVGEEHAPGLEQRAASSSRGRGCGEPRRAARGSSVVRIADWSSLSGLAIVQHARARVVRSGSRSCSIASGEMKL